MSTVGYFDAEKGKWVFEFVDEPTVPEDKKVLVVSDEKLKEAASGKGKPTQSSSSEFHYMSELPESTKQIERSSRRHHHRRISTQTKEQPKIEKPQEQPEIKEIIKPEVEIQTIKKKPDYLTKAKQLTPLEYEVRLMKAKQQAKEIRNKGGFAFVSRFVDSKTGEEGYELRVTRQPKGYKVVKEKETVKLIPKKFQLGTLEAPEQVGKLETIRQLPQKVINEAKIKIWKSNLPIEQKINALETADFVSGFVSAGSLGLFESATETYEGGFEPGKAGAMLADTIMMLGAGNPVIDKSGEVVVNLGARGKKLVNKLSKTKGGRKILEIVSKAKESQIARKLAQSKIGKGVIKAGKVAEKTKERVLKTKLAKMASNVVESYLTREPMASFSEIKTLSQGEKIEKLFSKTPHEVEIISSRVKGKVTPVGEQEGFFKVSLKGRPAEPQIVETKGGNIEVVKFKGKANVVPLKKGLTAVEAKSETVLKVHKTVAPEVDLFGKKILGKVVSEEPEFYKISQISKGVSQDISEIQSGKQTIKDAVSLMKSETPIKTASLTKTRSINAGELTPKGQKIVTTRSVSEIVTPRTRTYEKTRGVFRITKRQPNIKSPDLSFGFSPKVVSKGAGTTQVQAQSQSQIFNVFRSGETKIKQSVSQSIEKVKQITKSRQSFFRIPSLIGQSQRIKTQTKLKSKQLFTLTKPQQQVQKTSQKNIVKIKTVAPTKPKPKSTGFKSKSKPETSIFSIRSDKQKQETQTRQKKKQGVKHKSIFDIDTKQKPTERIRTKVIKSIVGQKPIQDQKPTQDDNDEPIPIQETRTRYKIIEITEKSKPIINIETFKFSYPRTIKYNYLRPKSSSGIFRSLPERPKRQHKKKKSKPKYTPSILGIFQQKKAKKKSAFGFGIRGLTE